VDLGTLFCTNHMLFVRRWLSLCLQTKLMPQDSPWCMVNSLARANTSASCSQDNVSTVSAWYARKFRTIWLTNHSLLDLISPTLCCKSHNRHHRFILKYRIIVIMSYVSRQHMQSRAPAPPGDRAYKVTAAPPPAHASSKLDSTTNIRHQKNFFRSKHFRFVDMLFEFSIWSGHST
jgi:hypothetical protein